jgi:hypothetical protein
VLTLGGEQTPVDELRVSVADREFARDYRIELIDATPLGTRFVRIDGGVWRRRRDEPPDAMRAEFSEQRADRLRLVVTDNRNPPLNIEKVEYAAAARQVVLATPETRQPLRLYFGNPEALAPEYDFARNLPERLDPQPARAAVGARRENPDFVPPPLPLTERWPWLVYAVLGGVIVVLTGILASLSRTAIRTHDEVEMATSTDESAV